MTINEHFGIKCKSIIFYKSNKSYFDLKII